MSEQKKKFEHPTIDKTDRFLPDQEYRKAGFEIYSRPKSGPNLWSNRESRKTGKYWTEDEMAILIKRIAAKPIEKGSE